MQQYHVSICCETCNGLGCNGRLLGCWQYKVLPVLRAVQAHGDVLQGWMLAQLQLAASQSSAMTTAGTAAAQAGVSAAGAHAASDGGSGFGGGAAADTLRRLDTFLAANWQLYEEFVADLVHKVCGTAAAVCSNALCLLDFCDALVCPKAATQCRVLPADRTHTTLLCFFFCSLSRSDRDSQFKLLNLVLCLYCPAASHCSRLEPRWPQQRFLHPMLEGSDATVPNNSSSVLLFFFRLALQVLPQEADAAAAASCQQAVGKLILQLLLHLTAAWPPPQLAELTKQLLAAPAAASQLPSTDSVTAPAPILLRVRGKAAAGSPNTFVDPSNNGTAQHSSTRGSMGSSSGSAASDAAGVVVALLRLLQSCRLCSWQALAGADNEEAAGAALAALYACSLEAGQSGSSGLADMPATAVEAQKVGCHCQ